MSYPSSYLRLLGECTSQCNGDSRSYVNAHLRLASYECQHCLKLIHRKKTSFSKFGVMYRSEMSSVPFWFILDENIM